MFTKGFDRYVCFGDYIQCEVDGFTVTARVEYDQDTKIDDCDSFPEEYSVEMFGEDTPEHREHFEKALAARRAWFNDEWHYCGVVLSVSKRGIALDKHAASLWGIDCNFPGSDNSYLLDVANNLLSEALDVGKATLAELCAA